MGAHVRPHKKGTRSHAGARPHARELISPLPSISGGADIENLPFPALGNRAQSLAPIQ